MTTKKPAAVRKGPQGGSPADFIRQVNDVDYVGREEALAMLGIKRESLYTYVSRGMVKTLSEPGKKTSLYRKADLEKLKTRAGAKKGSRRVAQVLRYGEPVIQSWVSEIGPGGPRYRGHDALGLAREGRSLEYVADLIWVGLPPQRDRPWPFRQDADAGPLCEVPKSLRVFSSIRTLASIALAFSALECPGETAAQENARSSGVRLLTAFTGVSGYFSDRPHYEPASKDEFIVQRLMRGFGLVSREGADRIARVLSVALVLSVDHELSAPTFCARIASSAGVDACACVAAALMAQAGPMQAGGIVDLEEFLEGVLGGPPQSLASFADIPCFDHPLYDKDPRAQLLIEYVSDLPGHAPDRDKLLRFVERTYRESGKFPNLFAALAIFSMALGLPRGAAIYMHCLARTAGWVAHITEQRLAGGMLRPRARYMGTEVAPLVRTGSRDF